MMLTIYRNTIALAAAGMLFPAVASAEDFPEVIAPDFLETRTVALTQTVTLGEIPEGAKEVKLWIPVPSDSPWQRVLDLAVDEAPAKWELVTQDEGRGQFLYLTIADPKPGETRVKVSCLVERRGVHFPIDENIKSQSEYEQTFFQDSLVLDAPLMLVDDEVRKLAAEAVGLEPDIAKQAMLLVQKVAEFADHYSKDPSKPHCGRGSAQDCLENGGGCCTDLHSLFIAMARARGIPARMQYGYRLLDAKEGTEFDPGYRCWVEYHIPGAGWVPTDIVASDNADASNPYRWASLSPYRVWLWEGRSFELTPPAEKGKIHTMLCGWAEIDGKHVDPLPAADGTPSKLTRKVSFQVLSHDRPEGAPKLPE